MKERWPKLLAKIEISITIEFVTIGLKTMKKKPTEKNRTQKNWQYSKYTHVLTKKKNKKFPPQTR